MAHFLAAVSFLSALTGGVFDGSAESLTCNSGLTRVAYEACGAWMAKSPKDRTVQERAMHRQVAILSELKSDDELVILVGKLVAAKLATADDYYKRGIIEFQHNQDKPGLDDLSMAHRMEPANDTYTVEYAAQLVLIGNSKAAEPVIQNLLKHAPENPDALRTLGRIKYLRDDYPGAMVLYDKVLSIEKGVANWWYERGQVKEASISVEAAADDYAKAAELNPKHPTYLLAYGDALLAQDKNEEGMKQYKAAVELDPSIDNYLSLADGHIHMEEYKEADQVIAKAMALDPKYAPAFVVKGRSEMLQGLLPDAERDIEAALRLDPKSVRAHYYLGRVRDKQSRSAEALELYRSVEKVWTRDANLQDRIGLVLIDLERYEEAHKAFTKGLVIDPKNYGVLEDRALANIRLHHWKDAVADATEAAKGDPKDNLPYVRRAYAQWKLGNAKEAKADYDKAIEIEPKSRLALEERGDFLRLTNDLDGAQKDAEASLALPDPTADTYKLLGQIAEAREIYDEAERRYDQAMKADPKNPWGLEDRAWARIYLHKWMDAMNDCNSMVKALPKASASYYCRAEVYVGMDQHEKALPDLNRALALRKDDWASLFARARAEMKLRRDKLAVADFTALIKADYRAAESYYYRGTMEEDAKQFDKAEADYAEALKGADASWADDVRARLRDLRHRNGRPQDEPDVPQHLHREA